MSVFTYVYNIENVRGMYSMDWNTSGLYCHTHFSR